MNLVPMSKVKPWLTWAFSWKIIDLL